MSFGIYLHIPFCRRKCLYCDFPSYEGQDDLMEQYVAALCREIELTAKLPEIQSLGEVATIYVGGGTPTSLSPFLLCSVIKKLLNIFFIEKRTFPIEIEITVEVNPGTVSAAYLKDLFAVGVRRLSFGVQTFEDRLLKKIGRLHTAKEAEFVIQEAKKVGFTNISVDLMYGLPEQTVEDVQRSLEKAISFNLPHISMYGLQIEEGTPFFQWEKRGNLPLPSDDEIETMYTLMTEFLPFNGYERYEISNFAHPGYESRHNLGYWLDESYIGLGASASSFYGGKRWTHDDDIRRYIEEIEKGNRGIISEDNSTEETEMERKKHRMEEFCFLALRTARGIDTKNFTEKFGIPFETIYGEIVKELMKKGFMEEIFLSKKSITTNFESNDNTRFVRLTKTGMRFGNTCFREFLQ